MTAARHLRKRLGAAAIAVAAGALFAGPAPAAELARDHVVTIAELRHADPELEALLPTTLGGIALTIESQAGTDLSTTSGPFDTFLEGLGKSRADFTLASAYARGGDLKAEVGAWRVDGADTAMLLPSFEAVMQASSTTPLTITEETIAGRAVTRIGDPGQLTRGPLYVIVRGDMLLFVQTPEPALADEAMSKLPA
ncbi:MAG: hypothetical protein KDJ88_21795 [Bauldia sp.]|nr:hypothetical protein [Bauldia sp.]